MVPFFSASWIKKVTFGSEDDSSELERACHISLGLLVSRYILCKRGKKSYLVQVISPPYMEPDLILTHMPFWKWETWGTEVEYLACVTKLIRDRDF